MNTLPCFLYVMQAVPLALPKSYFLAICRLFQTFLWNKQKARISLSTLSPPKANSGIVLPNRQKYNNWAGQLTRILDWINHHTFKDWVGLEQTFLDVPLAVAPRVWTAHSQAIAINHPLTAATLHYFKLVCTFLNGPGILNTFACEYRICSGYVIVLFA